MKTIFTLYQRGDDHLRHNWRIGFFCPGFDGLFELHLRESVPSRLYYYQHGVTKEVLSPEEHDQYWQDVKCFEPNPDNPEELLSDAQVTEIVNRSYVCFNSETLNKLVEQAETRLQAVRTLFSL